MDQHTQAKVELWKNNVTEPDLKAELEGLMGDEERLNDAFYRDLAFGTAGLRGVLGVGTNRMNVYVVAQATQGVADYLNAHYDKPTLARARDSRLKGEDFQRVTASVLAANGVHVFVYPRIEPVPTLSFAVRYLHTSAGIVLTASHNPAKYNGYKVYNDNGGQITDEAAAEISANIEAVDPFGGVKMMGSRRDSSSGRPRRSSTPSSPTSRRSPFQTSRPTSHIPWSTHHSTELA